MDDVDLILVMSINPGFGGQSFMHSQLAKIETLRAMIDATGRDIPLEVDGGVTPETAPLCVAAGRHGPGGRHGGVPGRARAPTPPTSPPCAAAERRRGRWPALGPRPHPGRLSASSPPRVGRPPPRRPGVARARPLHHLLLACAAPGGPRRRAARPAPRRSGGRPAHPGRRLRVRRRDPGARPARRPLGPRQPQPPLRRRPAPLRLAAATCCPRRAGRLGGAAA